MANLQMLKEQFNSNEWQNRIEATADKMTGIMTSKYARHNGFNKIIDYLKTNGSITIRDALLKLEINSPQQYTAELVRLGLVKTEHKTNKNTGTYYVIYRWLND